MLASDRIYNAIERLKESGKMVYTSMGSIATSGGYYVAANSDRIYANMTSLTGSVGVVSSWWTFATMNDELGITNDQFNTGKYMGVYSSSRVLSESDQQMLTQHQDRFYQEFVRKVMTNRTLTYKESYSVAQGQIFTGGQAYRVSMVDEIGGFYDVVDDMADELNLDDPNVVFLRPRTDSGFSQAAQQVRSMLKGKFSLKDMSYLVPFDI